MSIVERIEEILAMPVGQDLDLLVSEHVMGWADLRPVTDGGGHTGVDPVTACRSYVPYWSRAWGNLEEILARMGILGYRGAIVMDATHYPGYLAGFDTSSYIVPSVISYIAHAYGETAPLAVCRAAVVACMGERLRLAYTGGEDVDDREFDGLYTYWGNHPWPPVPRPRLPRPPSSGAAETPST